MASWLAFRFMHGTATGLIWNSWQIGLDSATRTSKAQATMQQMASRPVVRLILLETAGAFGIDHKSSFRNNYLNKTAKMDVMERKGVQMRPLASLNKPKVCYLGSP